MIAADRGEVPGTDPRTALFGVSASCPLPDQPKDLRVYTAKGGLADRVTMIVGPTLHLLVELANQPPGFGLLVPFDELPQLVQKQPHSLRGWFDQQFPVILSLARVGVFADVLAQ